MFPLHYRSSTTFPPFSSMRSGANYGLLTTHDIALYSSSPHSALSSLLLGMPIQTAGLLRLCAQAVPPKRADPAALTPTTQRYQRNNDRRNTANDANYTKTNQTLPIAVAVALNDTDDDNDDRLQSWGNSVTNRATQTSHQKWRDSSMVELVLISRHAR